MSVDPRGPYRASVIPAGGGSMGALIRSYDWSRSPVGPIESWSTSLMTMVETMLGSKHPMFLWWGTELTQFYNDAYVPSFGRGKHPLALGQRGEECWGEIWPIIGPQIEGVITRGEATWHEDALVPIFRNGKIEEVYWTYGYSPVFDDSRSVAGVLVVCTETTTRVLAHRRQRLFRLVAERGSLIVDPAEVLGGVFGSFVEAAADIPCAAVFEVGSKVPTHSVGLGAADLAHLRGLADTIAGTTTPLRLSLRGHTITAGTWPDPIRELFVVPAHGRPTFVFGIGSQLNFDASYQEFLIQLVDYIVLALDRTESFSLRARAEAERRDLLLQAPVATALMTGPDHMFELANELYVEMVGRPVEGMTYLEAFPELTDTPLPAILDDVYRRGVPFVTNEMLVPIVRHGTEQNTFFKFNLQPIRDPSGVVFGMMAVAVDVTEAVLARQLQAEAHARLQQAHDDRTHLVRELESANRAKDEFLAMLGHELRNPLAPIVTALELQKMRLGDGDSAEQRVLERQVAHLTRLVDDLLDVSKITRGKVELKKEVVDVGNLLAKATEMASYLLEERGHRLRIEVPETPLQWWGDPVRLAQVVANLLTNAARYTPAGGDIQLSARVDDGQIVISVIDNGIGIAADLLPTIFNLFVQGRRSDDRAEGGLGIGLSLVSNLVALHGGTVTATSKGLGHGSQFEVRLPHTELPAGADRAARPTSAIMRGAKRVLVVDDNLDAAELLAEYLREVGHEVAVAHDPLIALRLFPEFRPDIAFLDIGLPVMNGYELAAKLRETGSLGSCRLVAVTGYGQDSDRARSNAAGFWLHLVKPVNVAAILSAITDPSSER